MPGRVIQTTEENEENDRGLPARDPYYAKEHGQHQIIARGNDAGDIGGDFEALPAPPRKQGKPSRWQERRRKENAKLAEQQKIKIEPVQKVEMPTAIPKLKKGRPVGWRKEMGVSYGDFARMSRAEKEVWEMIK